PAVPAVAWRGRSWLRRGTGRARRTAGPRERGPAAAQRRTCCGGRGSQVGRGRGRGTCAQRVGHDQAWRDVLPGGGTGRQHAAASRIGGRWRGTVTVPAIWAVIPAAGRGTRFGGEMPKQYLEAAGQPLIAHALDAL